MPEAVFNRFTVRLSKRQAEMGYHSGQCYQDVKELAEMPPIKEQLELLDPAAVREELKSHGAWTSEDLQDHEENLLRVLWLACAEVADLDEEEEEEEEEEEGDEDEDEYEHGYEYEEEEVVEEEDILASQHELCQKRSEELIDAIRQNRTAFVRFTPKDDGTLLYIRHVSGLETRVVYPGRRPRDAVLAFLSTVHPSQIYPIREHEPSAVVREVSFYMRVDD